MEFIEELDQRFLDVKSNEMFASPEIIEYAKELSLNDSLLNDYLDDSRKEAGDQSIDLNQVVGNWMDLFGDLKYSGIFHGNSRLMRQRYFTPLYHNNKAVLLLLYFYKKAKELYPTEYWEHFVNCRAGFNRFTTMNDFFFFHLLADCLSSYLRWNKDPNDDFDLVGENNTNFLSENDNPYLTMVWFLFFDDNLHDIFYEYSKDEIIAVTETLCSCLSRSVSNGKNIVKRHPEILDYKFWERPRRSPERFAEEIKTLFDD